MYFIAGIRGDVVYTYTEMKNKLKFTGYLVVVAGIVLSMCSPLEAQNTTPELKRNALYFELFGQGVLYSFNYDYRISPDFSVRAGFTSWGVGFWAGRFQFTGFPLMINHLSGTNKGHFEAGIGLMPVVLKFQGGADSPFYASDGDGTITSIIGTATLGYRYQPPQGGFVFRAGITPMVGQRFILIGGISAGFAF